MSATSAARSTLRSGGRACRRCAAPAIDSPPKADAGDVVISASPGADAHVSVVTPDQLAAVRDGARPTVMSQTSNARLRVVGRKLGARTILVSTDVARVDDSLRILSRAALIGSP